MKPILLPLLSLVFVMMISCTKETSLGDSIPARDTLASQLKIQPFDVIFNAEDRLLYFLEKSGMISIYDLSQERITKQWKCSAELGYGDFAVHQNKKELYISRMDKYISILDAITLEKKDSIWTGYQNNSVIYDKDKLFITTGFIQGSQALKVYSRADGKLLSENQCREGSRIKKIPNKSTTELISMSLRSQLYDQRFFQFDEEGKLVATSERSGEHLIDGSIFEIFPTGDRYISSVYGTVFKKDLNPMHTITNPNAPAETFTCFAFDTTERKLLGGCLYKTIRIYDFTDYSLLQTITTKYYPFRVFMDRDVLVCVSETELRQLFMLGSNTYPNDRTSSVGRIAIELFDRSGKKLN